MTTLERMRNVDLERFARTRRDTLELVAPLSIEDCAAQSMPGASPAKWHLAHTSWFFETFVLERALSGYRPFDPAFRHVFNSYYSSVGSAHSRSERGLLTRPSFDDVRAYRSHVDSALRDLIVRGVDAETALLIEVGLNHEEQHQELLITDVKHLFSRSPLHPSYRERAPERRQHASRLEWTTFESGLREIGHGGERFAFDNETPRHRVFLDEFALASRPATNREWLAFVEDGGYARQELWLSDGFDTVRRENWSAPIYWMRRDGDCFEHTLAGLLPLDLDEPACHLSYYEADAFARWSGARLPTEFEWEVAARQASVDGQFADSRRFHPRTAPAGELAQMFGDVWEWTSSAYSPYPGYRPWAGDIGEYNGKFMCNQMVLRGGSCATPRGHVRPSYRNFFHADARWQFSGVRLARTAG